MTLVSSVLNRRPSGDTRTWVLPEKAMHLIRRYSCRADDETALKSRVSEVGGMVGRFAVAL